MQGTYPVLFLSFAGVKENQYDITVHRICDFLEDAYQQNDYLLDSAKLTKADKKVFKNMAYSMSAQDASIALYKLSYYLFKHFGKKAIILMDEYDTPLQEAYVNGYWKESVAFTRSLFNNTFKTNPYLERAVMTGITRVSNTSYEVSESIFSDLNNLKVITMTSDKYASYFGFTESEVFAAMDEFGLTNKEEVKSWYDGFTIGNLRDIYNPWSIISFLDEKS